jgi:hypothetical protein
VRRTIIRIHIDSPPIFPQQGLLEYCDTLYQRLKAPPPENR